MSAGYGAVLKGTAVACLGIWGLSVPHCANCLEGASLSRSMSSMIDEFGICAVTNAPTPRMSLSGECFSNTTSKQASASWPHLPKRHDLTSTCQTAHHAPGAFAFRASAARRISECPATLAPGSWICFGICTIGCIGCGCGCPCCACCACCTCCTWKDAILLMWVNFTVTPTVLPCSKEQRL